MLFMSLNKMALHVLLCRAHPLDVFCDWIFRIVSVFWDIELNILNWINKITSALVFSMCCADIYKGCIFLRNAWYCQYLSGVFYDLSVKKLEFTSAIVISPFNFGVMSMKRLFVTVTLEGLKYYIEVWACIASGTMWFSLLW